MKSNVLFFVFIVCSLIFSCSIKSRSSLFSDGGYVLTINGVAVEKFEGLPDVQKEAIYQGKYKTNVLDNEYETACYTGQTGDVVSGDISIKFYDPDKKGNQESCEKYLKDKIGQSLSLSLTIYSQQKDKTLLEADKATVVRESDGSIGLNFDLVKQQDLIDMEKKVEKKEITVSLDKQGLLSVSYFTFSQEGVVCCLYDGSKLTGDVLKYEDMMSEGFDMVEVKRCTNVCDIFYSNEMGKDNLPVLFKTNTGRECVKNTNVATQHMTMKYTLNNSQYSCEILMAE